MFLRSEGEASTKPSTFPFSLSTTPGEKGFFDDPQCPTTLTSFDHTQVYNEEYPEDSFFKLVVNRTLYFKCSRGRTELQCCLIADTHYEKSRVVGELIARSKELEESPTVAPDDGREPISANCNYFVGSMDISQDNQRGIMVDMEGNSGQDYIPLDEENKEVMYEECYYDSRRNSVKQHLPRLAYVTSHLVVCVSLLDDSNSSYKGNVLEIAASCATIGVQNAEKPSLLLIHNKPQGMKSFETANESTHKFEQGQFKIEVKYLKLPYIDSDLPESKEHLISSWKNLFVRGRTDLSTIRSIVTKKQFQFLAENGHTTARVPSYFVGVCSRENRPQNVQSCRVPTHRLCQECKDAVEFN